MQALSSKSCLSCIYSLSFTMECMFSKSSKHLTVVI